MATDDVSESAAAGVREVAELFDASRLGRPPVPRVMREAFRSRGDWFFATREMEAGFMYGFHEYVLEVVSRAVDNYVAVSHAGHGINSYAINYHLVFGRLALFAQTLWGGVGRDDEDADAARVAAQLDRCARLIRAYEAYAAADLLPAAPARLIVAEHLGGGGLCRWLHAPISDRAEATAWLQESWDLTDLPIDAAHDLLAQPDLYRTA